MAVDRQVVKNEFLINSSDLQIVFNILDQMDQYKSIMMNYDVNKNINTKCGW